MIAKIKNSGVKWIGNIPTQWTIAPLGRVFYEKQIKNLDGKEKNVLSLSYGKIINRDIESNYGLLPESFNTYQIVDKEDIILRLTDLQNDKRSLRIGYVNGKGIITSAYLCLSLLHNANLNNTEYLYYTLHSYDILKIFYNLGAGVRQSMGYEELKRLPLIVPPLEEQTKIVQYIKSKEEKINHFIQQKQQLIELLKEQRQCVINEAVTKGINPKAKMKASGAEWLGDIPEHWEVRRLKNVSRTISKGTTPSTVGSETTEEGTIRFLRAENLYENRITLSPVFYIDEKTDEILFRSRLETNDVLLVIAGATIGRTGIVTKEMLPANTNQAVCFIRPQNIMADFLLLWMQTTYITSQIWLNATQAAQPNLAMSKISTFYILYPIIKEQHQIVEHIKTETATIDIAIAKAEKEIELIKEYKEAMISEVVMGKIDVKSVEIASATPKKEANWEFKEAVLISVLTDKFGSIQYPLGRKRYTKFSYLFHRHTDNRTEGYLQKAVGPYNPKTKYAGPEKIALQNRYVEGRVNGNYSGFVAGIEISNAKNYFENYWDIEALNWIEQFRKKTNDELELYTTVDKAMVELAENKKVINLQTVKLVIDEHPEWKPKLERDIFSDKNIIGAIEFLKQLFI